MHRFVRLALINAFRATIRCEMERLSGTFSLAKGGPFRCSGLFKVMRQRQQSRMNGLKGSHATGESAWMTLRRLTVQEAQRTPLRKAALLLGFDSVEACSAAIVQKRIPVQSRVGGVETASLAIYIERIARWAEGGIAM
jgi:hypothetical protein